MSSHRVICTPIDWPLHTPNASTLWADCGHEVWTSPATTAFLDERADAQTICLRCLPPEEIRRIVTEGLMREMPGQRPEIESVLGEAETERAFRAFGTKPLED